MAGRRRSIGGHVLVIAAVAACSPASVATPTATESPGAGDSHAAAGSTVVERFSTSC